MSAATDKLPEGRDAAGHWKPPYPCATAPLFELPPRPGRIASWLFRWGGFLFPWHLLFLAAGGGIAWFLRPRMDQPFGPLWVLGALGCNALCIAAVYGGLHLVFYTLKLHGSERKYHPSFHQEPNKRFLFRSQVYDNLFRSLVFGLPIWTAYEVLWRRAYAAGLVPAAAFSDNPLWFVGLFILIPFWRAVHFYLIHRLIHWRPLFRAVHSVHHMNPNPGPWTGLSMHPLEHLLYFSALGIHFLVPTHPWHFFFHSLDIALGPALGHVGFEGPCFKGALPVGDYFHYLHHKHVSCNFGLDLLPLDKWFGRFYDGEGPYRTKNTP